MTRTEILDQIEAIEMPENMKIFIVIEEEKEESFEIEMKGKLSNIGFENLIYSCLEKPEYKNEVREIVLKDFINETKQQYEPVVNMLVSAFSSAFEKPEVEQKEEIPVNQLGLFPELMEHENMK